MFVLENHRIRDKYEQKILFKLHLSIVKGKRNGLTFTECSVKIRRFHRHIENEATTMQRNRSARSQTLALKMRVTHVPLESVW